MRPSFRHALAVSVLLGVASPAKAGENLLLGTLTSTGASVNNQTTAVPFVVPAGSRLTIVCDAAARLLTDQPATATSGATKGVPLAANTLFPTSAGRAQVLVGGRQSALLAVISASGTANCDVWQRDGNE